MEPESEGCMPLGGQGVGGWSPQMGWSWAERPGQEVLATRLSQEARD